MCWNATRQAYVALFPSSLPSSPHPLASVSLPSPKLPVSPSISLFYFFHFYFDFFWCVVPWLPCGHSVRCVCLLRQYVFQTERDTGDRHLQTSTHAHTQVHICVYKHRYTHIHAHACTASVLVLKRSWEKTDVKISSLEVDRKWVIREKIVGSLTRYVHTHTCTEQACVLYKEDAASRWNKKKGEAGRSERPYLE